MSRPCRWAVFAFAALYAVAFALFLIGSYGWFGSPQGPLAGVFLVPLGLPWILAIDGRPESLRPAAGAAAPALNLLLLWRLCRWRAGRWGPSRRGPPQPCSTPGHCLVRLPIAFTILPSAALLVAVPGRWHARVHGA